MDKLTYIIDYLSPSRVRVIVKDIDREVGVLYFEPGKKGYVNKPIGMGGWICVDAKIEGLYENGGKDITPKQIISHIQDLLKCSLE